MRIPKILSVFLILSTALAATAATPPLPERKPEPPAGPLPPLPDRKPKPPMPLTPTGKLYYLLDAETLWTTPEGAATPLAESLRHLLLSADDHGLRPRDYWTPALEEMFSNLTSLSAPRFEAAATQALLKFAAHLNTGRIDPKSIGETTRVKRPSLSIEKVAEALKTVVPDLRPAFQELAPQWPEYRSMQAALARLKAVTEAEYPEIKKPKRDPKLGSRDRLFADIKIRLAALGYEVAETDDVYSKELRDLVRQYMADHSLPGATDLRRSSMFWPHITVALGSRLQQIRLNMEKLRWFPNPESKYVFVNLAFQRLTVREDGAVVLSMKTINGKPKRKSPTMRDHITDVELNPTWTVPRRLILEDKLPEIRRNPSWLAQNNYIVYNRHGRQLDPWRIDWWSVNSRNVGNITIKQRAGLGNALGVMKFNMANPYAIYLHDTNERSLFSQNHRLLSSGCVRLERPLDLSTFLLRDHPHWNNPDRVSDNLATTKVAERGVRVEHHIRLSEPVPVYLMNLTVDAEGSVIKFAGDYYGQDEDLSKALR